MDAMLRAAGKTYSACAKRTATRAGVSGKAERLIGFNVASEWARRAGALMTMTYKGNLMNHSTRSRLVTETDRFQFQWTALNAIFGRPSILALVGPKGRRPRGVEMGQFRLVVEAAGVPAADVAARTKAPRNLLASPMSDGVTTLAALHTRHLMQLAGKATADTIARAARSGSFASLDLPILIYAARNWFVHGVMTDAAFHSPGKFRAFVDTLNEALASVHQHAAAKLLTLV